MASVLGEVYGSSIAAVKFCSHAIASRETRSRSSLSNRLKILAILAVDIQEVFLRALGLSELDLVQLTCTIVTSDLVRSQRIVDADELADLITCSIVNAVLSKSTRKVEFSSNCF